MNHTSPKPDRRDSAPGRASPGTPCSEAICKGDSPHSDGKWSRTCETGLNGVFPRKRPTAARPPGTVRQAAPPRRHLATTPSGKSPRGASPPTIVKIAGWRRCHPPLGSPPHRITQGRLAPHTIRFAGERRNASAQLRSQDSLGGAKPPYSIVNTHHGRIPEAISNVLSPGPASGALPSPLRAIGPYARKLRHSLPPLRLGSHFYSSGTHPAEPFSYSLPAMYNHSQKRKRSG